MRKKIFMGIMLAIGTMSFANIYELGPVGQGTYSGEAKVELRIAGNAVAKPAGLRLEIKPTMSMGPRGESLEFRFGDLSPNAQVRAQGAFTAEVIDYSTPTPTKLNLKDKVKVTLENNGTERDLKNTNQDNIGKITYTLMNTKGTSLDINGTITQDTYTYEGNIESYIVVNGNADAGEFYDSGSFVTVEVTNIEKPASGTP